MFYYLEQVFCLLSVFVFPLSHDLFDAESLFNK